MSANAKPGSGSMSPEDALDPARALTPAVIRVNAARVRSGFWPKLRRTAARIPFADRLLSVYYAARDPETPPAAKAMMLGALAYFVMPFDAVPDMLVGVGFTDDAAVITAVIALMGAHIRPRHLEAARQRLEALSEDEPT